MGLTDSFGLLLLLRSLWPLLFWLFSFDLLSLPVVIIIFSVSLELEGLGSEILNALAIGGWLLFLKAMLNEITASFSITTNFGSLMIYLLLSYSKTMSSILMFSALILLFNSLIF
nr:hypothetical protein [Mycoplasmopsis bovis]